MPQEQQLGEDAVSPGGAGVDIKRGLDLAKRIIELCWDGGFEKHVADDGPEKID